MKVIAILALAATVAASADPYVQFLTGFLSTLEPAIGGQVTPCIQGTTGGITSVRVGFGLIENGLAQGNVTAVFQGALQFKTALTDIQTAAASCGATEVEADVTKIINELQNNPLGVVAALFPYATTIVEDLQDGIKSFKAANYTQAGADVGSVLSILLIDNAAATLAKVKAAGAATDPYVEFLNGLLTTLAPAVGGKVVPCLSGADGGIANIRAGIALLKQAIHDHNFTAAFDAADDFVGALEDIKAAATQCNVPEVATDVETLIDDITNHPLDVLYKLLPHALTIVTLVEGSAQAFSSANYNLAGQDIGSILSYILN